MASVRGAHCVWNLMKLCDHRLVRNRPSSCYLMHLHNGSRDRYREHRTLFRDDRLSGLDLSIHLHCDDEMTDICPFREWAPKLKCEPDRNFWTECEACGRKHREEQAHQTCLSWHNFLALYRSKETKAWRPEGTTEEYLSIGPGSELHDKVRNWLWRRIRRYVKRRDGGRCTECGIEVKGRRVPYEIHHIVPRSRGGTEHPANLRTLCSVCHRKYTKELLEDNTDRRRRARERPGREIGEDRPAKDR
ncbi:MAG TPA: HNH endonuclease [Methanomassiliicoccales archaeon]|nr:HNH endonuclease [Methanomassiliicoccales archaeon]HPR98289.1 HNH endonuclease [Methanomassiliicoccales archaeon]